jgi:hypothetical protein
LLHYNNVIGIWWLALGIRNRLLLISDVLQLASSHVHPDAKNERAKFEDASSLRIASAGFQDGTCKAKAAVIDLINWCTNKGPNTNPSTTTCAAVDCSKYSENGVPMQNKSDVNPTMPCVAQENCNVTCCAPSMELAWL